VCAFVSGQNKDNSNCEYVLLSNRLRRLARDVVFIPKTLGHCTAFQFGLNTRELFVSADEEPDL